MYGLPSFLRPWPVLFLVWILGSSGLAHAQSLDYSGLVRDADTREALAFVNITRLSDRQGVVTDLDGRFRLEARPGDTLLFSYVGYRTHRLVLPHRPTPLTIDLEPTAFDLLEVVVRPGENPAWRIIREALARRDHHDPQRRAGYSFQAYHKSVLAVDSLSRPGRPANVSPRDSVRWDALLNRMDWWVKESATLNYYRRPNLRKERIIAGHSSLPNDPSVGFTPIDFQPFGFYQEVIPLEFAQRRYINPLSENTFQRYDFTLSDTILHAGGDTTYVIAFRPYAGKNFDGLVGLLYIHTAGYALENVIAEPADTAQLLWFRIQQQYRRLGGEWFPVALQTDLSVSVGIRELHATYAVRNRTHLSRIDLRPPPTDVFDHLIKEELPTAETVPESAWDTLRTEPLSEREANAYTLWDSLPELRGAYRVLNTYSGLLKLLATGRLGSGPLELVLTDLIRLNRYEGARLGLGLRTGARFSEWLQLYGYAGYGTKDHAWKYGGHVEFALWPRKDLRLRLGYQRDLAEPGAPTWLSETLPLLTRVSVRNTLRYRLDSLQRWRAELFYRPLPYLQLNPYLQREARQLTYDYRFGEAPTNRPRWTHWESGLNLRLAPGETMQRIGTIEAVLRRSFPVFDLQIARGQLTELDLFYHKIVAQFEHEFTMKALGTTRLRLTTGQVDRAVPYPYLFNAPGIGGENGGGNLFAGPAFQNMGLYEFAADRFAYLFLSHNFGNLLWRPRTPYCRPELRLLQNIAWGDLRRPGLHQLLDVQAPRRGYFETGAQLNNLLRIPYFKALYMGFGVGAFLRWGPYRLPVGKENWRWQVTVTMSV